MIPNNMSWSYEFMHRKDSQIPIKWSSLHRKCILYARHYGLRMLSSGSYHNYLKGKFHYHYLIRFLKWREKKAGLSNSKVQVLDHYSLLPRSKSIHAFGTVSNKKNTWLFSIIFSLTTRVETIQDRGKNT